MDYEKKYKEALERARKWYNDSHITIGLKGNLKDIFPELAEPDDERIRKMLIEFFGKGAENNGSTNGISDKDILAWLEKQGEQKVNYTASVETGNGGINALVTRELPTQDLLTLMLLL